MHRGGVGGNPSIFRQYLSVATGSFACIGLLKEFAAVVVAAVVAVVAVVVEHSMMVK